MRFAVSLNSKKPVQMKTEVSVSVLCENLHVSFAPLRLLAIQVESEIERNLNSSSLLMKI